MSEPTCPHCGCRLADGFRSELEHHATGCPNTPLGAIRAATLDYFKPSGKWYGHGELELAAVIPFHEIIGRVAELQHARRLPGLAPGHSNYSVLITVAGFSGPVLWDGKHMLWGEIDP
jgi:hypothetical protein